MFPLCNRAQYGMGAYGASRAGALGKGREVVNSCASSHSARTKGCLNEIENQYIWNLA